MKWSSKLVASLLVMFMFGCLIALPASAATTTQDGLEVTLTTDKTEYTKNEQITATLKVKNTNSETISNVSLETLIPDGYKVSDGVPTVKQTDVLNANESVELSVKYLLSNTSSDVVSGDSGKNTDNNKTINNVSSNISSGTSSGSTTSPKTGILNNYSIWIIFFIVASVVITAMIVLKKKPAKSMLSLFLCISIICAITAGSVEFVSAAEVQTKTISISEKVDVNNTNLIINAMVKYNVNVDVNTEDTESTGSKKTDEPSVDNEYYTENSEKVVKVIDVKKSSSVPTESEVATLLKERGFGEYPITYEFSIDAEYVDEKEVSENSTEKHPMYMTYYMSESGDVWSIFVINGDLFANPASFNLESELAAQLLVSESEKLTSYDDSANKFYVTIPKESAVIVKTVNRIDTNTLNKLTVEELSKS